MGENNSLRNSILPSAISGGAGLLGSFLGSIASARQNKKMQEYDWKKFLAQNEFNHNEAQLARDFEEQMYTKYMDYDSQVEKPPADEPALPIIALGLTPALSACST